MASFGLPWILVIRLVTMAASASVLATTEPTAEEWAWQSNLTTVHERLQYLYKSGQYSDLSISFPDYQENVTVHKLVLAMSSPVFGSMFMGASGVGSELFLHDSPKKFYKLLDHMYQDRMDLHSVDEALDLYTIAIKYKVEGAIRTCSKFIIENLTPNTTLAALEASLRSGDVAMQNKSLEMLNKDPDGTIEPKAVEGLKLETLKGLIHKDLYVSSELLVFQAVIAWGKAQLTQKGEETSGNAIRREAEALLREVRFLTLKCDEFIDNVVTTEIFSPSESIAILRVIRGGNVTLIPESTPVSHSTRNRIRDPKDLITASMSCGRQHSFFRNRYSDKVKVNTFSVNEDIFLHSIKTRIDGSLEITDNNRNTIVSTSSNDVFKFPVPIHIERDITHKIYFVPPTTVDDRSGTESSTFTSGSTTIRYKSYNCIVTEIKFWSS
ncbi:BTB/POZ domain-containing protein 6-A-like isoform X2 [Oratosquilla oratoria]|uniref:BTB/POZ domain-containing protein 6-A-like isoform X2 n=1 Tax=Oratosquilla oratoria TaxID=337810 RepID=UPI003F764F88